MLAVHAEKDSLLQAIGIAYIRVCSALIYTGDMGSVAAKLT